MHAHTRHSRLERRRLRARYLLSVRRPRHQHRNASAVNAVISILAFQAVLGLPILEWAVVATFAG